MTVASDVSSGGPTGTWLFKNKEHGRASAAASMVSITCFLFQETVLVIKECDSF